ncbi:MAG TPA: hypothetical protein H9833_04370 [Candidatus Evtepia faecavium]|nr:hypothetical protein [Candidatus Evtepia faecavium]
MDQKKRSLLVLAIAITVCAAVFVSIGVPALTGRAPEVTLPNVNQEAVEEDKAFLPVEVTPDTVQNVIASLSRPESYHRELTVSLFWSGGDSTEAVEIWADEGYVRTTIATGGAVQYRLVGDGKLRLWYAGDQTWQETEAEDATADLAQRIPTYEDVLDVDPQTISDAGYEEKNGSNCIFVAVKRDGRVTDHYWISTDTGLLCAAETYESGRKVYEMGEDRFSAPLEEGMVFSLPDGTVLHESSAVAVPEE